MPARRSSAPPVAVLLALAAFVAGPGARAQPADAGPEPVVRAFVRAMFAHDRVAFGRLTVPHPDAGRLTRGGRPDPEALAEFDADPGAYGLREARPPEHRGRPAAPVGKAGYPVGTTALYVAAPRGHAAVVRLVRRPEGWRVDLRWWLAAGALVEGKGDAPGTPAHAARALTAALLRLDRDAAVRLARGGPAAAPVLFDGAPAQPEPSGHLDALAAEMPLVEIGPGEFAVLPSGRVVEGASDRDVRVLVGLFGQVEVPFVVRRTAAGWRAEPEPYFALLNR